MSLDKFTNWIKEQSSSLKAAVQKFRDKDFLEAVIAGCAMVASADGNISPEEKRKTINFIQQNDALSVFKVEEAIELFEAYTNKINFDVHIGKAEALKSIAKLKNKQDEARLMIRVFCAIGASDGNFDENEKKVVREICNELGLNPQDFNLNENTVTSLSNVTSLSKGSNVSLTKKTPGLKKIQIGIGWDIRGVTDGTIFDLDVSLFMLKNDGKIRSDNDFIFYNNKKSTCGSIEYNDDNLKKTETGDNAVIKIDLEKVPVDIKKITVAVTIHEAELRKQNFGMVANAFIRILNSDTNKEITRYDLSEDASTNTAMIFGRNL